MADYDAPYQAAAGFVPMPTQAAINAYVGVARLKRDRESGTSVPEHAPLGNIVQIQSGKPLKRKNDSSQTFSQTNISKRHRPVADVVEIEAKDLPILKAGETRRFCGVTRDILPASSSFVSIAKRGLIPVRLPYSEGPKVANKFVAGLPIHFGTSKQSKDKHLGTLDASFNGDIIGTALSCMPGQDFYVHLHPISCRAMKRFALALLSKGKQFSQALQFAVAKTATHKNPGGQVGKAALKYTTYPGP